MYDAPSTRLDDPIESELVMSIVALVDNVERDVSYSQQQEREKVQDFVIVSVDCRYCEGRETNEASKET